MEKTTMTWTLDEDTSEHEISQRGSPNAPAVWQMDQAPQKKKTTADFSWFEQNFTNEGVKAKRERDINFLKSTLSSASFGYSEYFDSLKVDPELDGVNEGNFTGAILPIGIISKAVSLPFKAIQGYTKFSQYGKQALDISGHAITGALYGAGKESANVLVKGEEFKPIEIAKEAATFAALGAIIQNVPPVYNWIKNKLNPSQQAKMLIEGILPDDLTPNQYKFWEEEGLPAIHKSAQKEYQEGLQIAQQKSELDYRQKLANTQAEHESELLKLQKEQNLDESEAFIQKNRYDNKIRQIAAEHEAELAEIENANKQAQAEYANDLEEYERMKARQAAVAEATILKPGEENLPYRPANKSEFSTSLENKIGNIISDNEITNTTNAGKSNTEAIRANDAIDYQHVNEAYAKSDKLNETVTSIQPSLVQDLQQFKKELFEIPEPSPPQKQLLTAYEKILDKMRTVDENGNITGFLEISNRVLQEQAKAFRYFMDFSFEHGNTKGIFSPTVRRLEQAVEEAAMSVGKPEAAEASREARELYRQWSNDYNNDYIRPYRDRNNQDFSKLFKSSLDLDEFIMIDNILNRSNSGQQLSQATRRSLVEKHLSKYLENPHAANPIEFEKTLKELRTVIDKGQENAIRDQFNVARKQPPIKQPIPPKLKEMPSEVKVPLNNLSKNKTSMPESVKIPKKAEVEITEEMKMAANRMKMKPEQAMKLTDTPSGIKEIKKSLNNSPQDNKLFERIGRQKLRNMVYKGKIKHNFTGKELGEIFNEGDNFQILSEIVGEKEAVDILDWALEIGDKRATVDSLQKFTKHSATIKAALIFGIL